MNLAYNSEAPKRVNVSKRFENYINELLKKKEEKRWREENLQAITSFNERVEKHGVFSDDLRSF